MKAVVDRIEGDRAVLLFGDEEIKVDFPLVLLPAGVNEGSIIQATFQLDHVSESQQREKISDLLEKLKDKNK